MELPVSRTEAAQVQRSTGNIHSIIDWWSGEGFQDFLERGILLARLLDVSKAYLIAYIKVFAHL